MTFLSRVLIVTAMLAAPAFAADPSKGGGLPPRAVNKDPYPSTYAPRPSPVTAIVGARILVGDGADIPSGTVVMSGGLVLAAGVNVTVPPGAVVVDGKGKVVTPGIIDNHSHLGDYAVPEVQAHNDGNEATDPNTAQVWAEHSVWPHDPAFSRALAGGVTAMQILPGSANLIGGRSAVVKNVWSRTVQGMKFPGVPYGLKMACGENPKRVYGADQKRDPATRMGNFAGYRAAWIKAQEYKDEWDRFEAKKAKGKLKDDDTPPKRDLQLETLAGALRGEVVVHMHCYRADEMAQVIDMAKEFGYRVTAFHHAVEAYKVADLLAEADICASLWADWWGFKLEAFDGIEENIPLVHAAGGCAIVHSDSNVGNQRLNQEAAKALAAGRRMGLDISDGQAWKWLSLNPARSLKIDGKVGTLQPGKIADVVVWNGNPFSVYTRADKVYVDGALAYDVNDASKRIQSDFELGYSDKEAVR